MVVVESNINQHFFSCSDEKGNLIYYEDVYAIPSLCGTPKSIFPRTIALCLKSTTLIGILNTDIVLHLDGGYEF